MDNLEKSGPSIHGAGWHRSKVNQQAQGYQFNIENAIFNSSPLREFSSAYEHENWPLVFEVDPLEIGVHRAPVNQGNAVPDYVSRDIDSELTGRITQVLRYGGILLIIGDSTAGKTRTAYEAVLAVSPDRRLCKPYDKEELRQALVPLGANRSDSILWLDDLERYIGADGFTSAVATYLRRSGISAIATIRSEQYRRFIHPIPDRNSLEHPSISDFEKIVDQCQSVMLPRLWSSQEVERARTSEDRRIVEAAEHSTSFGIAEYLAAGPSLLDEWQLAWGVEANPRGASLISAAIDCARAGISAPIPRSVLVELHEWYLADAGGDFLRPESFDRAFSWATRRRAGVASPLIPFESGKTFRAFDYLVDSVMRRVPAIPVPDSVWSRALELSKTEADSLFGVASAARREKATQIEVEGWTALASLGDARGAIQLGNILSRTGSLDRAIEWFEKAAQMGDLEGWTLIGLIAEQRRSFAKSEEYYRRAAEGGDSHGMHHLASLLRIRGNQAESEYWFRRALSITTERHDISINLATLLIDTGQFDEAESFLRSGIEKGQNEALGALGYLYSKSDRVSEARELWRDAAEKGVANAAAQLALDAESNENFEEAESWWNRASELGLDEAELNLGMMLEKLGRLDEAEELFRNASDREAAGADRNYAIFLVHRKNYKQAERLARSAFDSGDEAAALLIARILKSQDRAMEEIVPWLERASNAGDHTAQGWLGDHLLMNGDLEGAKSWLTLALAGGDPSVVCALGDVYGELRQIDKAVEMYRRSFDAGHEHAACRHGSLLLQEGKELEAIERFTAAFHAGHNHVASLLAKLCAQQRQGRDAANWLRRANGQPATLEKGKGKKRAVVRKKRGR